MRALSILQPWAWLIASGQKDIENRTWPTRFRGTFLIHAGKRWGREQEDDLQDVIEQFPGIKLPPAFARGGIVGLAVIADCVSYSTSQWFNGPYGFVVRDAIELPFQPCRGMLNFFRPDLPAYRLPCPRKFYDPEVRP